jgi:hypothetical protein
MYLSASSELRLPVPKATKLQRYQIITRDRLGYKPTGAGELVQASDRFQRNARVVEWSISRDRHRLSDLWRSHLGTPTRGCLHPAEGRTRDVNGWGRVAVMIDNVGQSGLRILDLKTMKETALRFSKEP